MTRRTFGKICAASGAGAAVAPASAAAPWMGASPRRDGQSPAAAQDDDKLLSEWLFDLVIDTQPPHAIGDQLVVPVIGGTFEGPRLKGAIVASGGDWMTHRPDRSSVLDVRIVLRTDDAPEIYSLHSRPGAGHDYGAIGRPLPASRLDSVRGLYGKHRDVRMFFHLTCCRRLIASTFCRCACTAPATAGERPL
jgi:Protein of unknown function (DUF3237)